jgi:hypothetical protein
LGAILRWFYDGGTRHRAYLRHGAATPADCLELVIGTGQWQAAVTVTPETTLEDYSEQHLAEIARQLRAYTGSDLPAAGGE